MPDGSSIGERRRLALRAAALVVLLAGSACEEADPPVHLRVIGGDAERGRQAIVRHGCGACHAIPGIRTARGSVGPPLAAFATRSYIAGRLPNQPASLTRWLRNPPAIDPKTAMPALGLNEAEALDIAAYLYRLR